MDTSSAFSAPWILTAVSPPVRDGILIERAGRIEYVGPRTGADFDTSRERRFDGCAILPGLINAHTHLELHSLRGAISYEGSFARWLRRLIEEIRQREPDPGHVSAGIRESAGFGTTTVLDVTRRWDLSRGSIRRITLLETIGLGSEAADFEGERVEEGLQIAAEHGLPVGVTPHAPYTVGPLLYQKMAELARAEGLLLGTHAAESRAEEEFLLTGRGELRELYDWVGVFVDDWRTPGERTIPYLDRLGVLGTNTVLFHGNYVTEEEMRLIAQRGASVVYCPRSHRYFQHDPYPLEQYLAAGVNLCLGTDSLASNASLSMFAEMALVRARYPALPPQTILQLATANAAKALAMELEAGSLEPGKRAEFAVVKLPDETDPYGFLKEEEPQVVPSE